MPLFMDLHKATDYAVKPTIDEIKKNHIADLKTQAKYGVRFIQYWVNEEAGLVFCLMEGPDKEACRATHQEAHGDMPCNVIELQGGDYKVFMGDARVNEFDITEDINGRFDSGTRSFLVADVISFSDYPFSFDRLQEIAQRYMGREVGLKNGRIKFVFNAVSSAVDCAVAFQQQFAEVEGHRTEVRIAISSGEPVTAHQGIFEDVIELANWLCDITVNHQITISSHTYNSLSKKLPESNRRPGFKLMSHTDETLLTNFMRTLLPKLVVEQISIGKISKIVGISQAQLYRKITGLTGYSPNAFIHELRLRSALRLVNTEYGNIAQIAFASGFNSPSYFTKSFKKRFGTSPKNL